MVKIVLYQPEIAGNVGNIIRSCACFGCELHIIEPCGFPFDLQRVRKSAMDYLDKVNLVRHGSFAEFLENEKIKTLSNSRGKRLILATTKGDQNALNFEFQNDDLVLFGRESCGVPTDISSLCDAKIFIPMQNQSRSLNVAVSCAIVMAMALRNCL